jgi:hypothetical protein
MPNKYTRLRDQLAQESPELYGSFQRSWQIAEREWLPAVSGNRGSFNSFPHLRNLEHYADDILRQTEQLYPSRVKLDMTPVEMYLLLAAILFHDIGRTLPGKWHAHASRHLITKHFADLGIDGNYLASILADVCCYHACSEDMEANLDLRDHSVSPHGVIHCKRLAVFLKFIDNLDAAYTRVLPHYLSGNEPNLIEGFRRKTTDVRVDLRNHMVVATIGFDRWNLNPSRDLLPADVSADRIPDDPRAAAILVGTTPIPTWITWSQIEIKPSSNYEFLTAAPQAPRTVQSPDIVQKSCRLRPPFATAETSETSYLPLPDLDYKDRASLVPYLLMCNLAFPKLDFGPSTPVLDVSRLIFLALAGNVHSSAALLKTELAHPLATYGIPVRAWLIEYDEHLFTCFGRETFEPSLSSDLLKDVAGAMCQLSGGMFGRQPCSYRTLAAKLRVGDVNLVRTAVRRIAIVVRHKKSADIVSRQACYTVQFTQQDWRWCLPDDKTSDQHKEHSQEWVLAQLEELAEPAEDIS